MCKELGEPLHIIFENNYIRVAYQKYEKRLTWCPLITMQSRNSIELHIRLTSVKKKILENLIKIILTENLEKYILIRNLLLFRKGKYYNKLFESP